MERFALARGMALKKDNHYQALVAKDGGLWLVLPQTFMNASGRAVQMLAGFFKIPAEEILVVHDELDFPPGTARIKQGGGISGHNGLRDISQRLGSHDYWRLRLGVGRPADKDGADYVLEKPPAEEREAIEGSIARALEVLPQMLEGDAQGAMNKLHSQDKPVVSKKAEEKKPEPNRPEAKKSEPAPAPKPEAKVAAKPEGGLKGFFKGLTGSKK